MSSLIASLVPGLLRSVYRTRPTPMDDHASFGGHGALVWCDVAKFSPLANRLVGLGADGVERLSSILNRHFDAVLGTALDYGGDPIEFFGDGVLIAFFCEESELADAVRVATACAAEIILSCRPELEPQLQLSLHLHITAGSLTMLDLGGVGNERVFAMVGDAMTQLGDVTRDQAPNRVILSPSAARLLPVSPQGPTLPNGGGVLIESVPAVPRPLARVLPDESSDALTAFVPLSVRHGLEIGALHWSAELRTIAAVFLRLPQLDHAAANFAARMHELSRLVQNVCRRYEGAVRCLAFDDKGAGFQLVFGVPPLAHNDDPLRALRAVQELLMEFGHRGLTCSAGITVGVAYLGIIGHAQRRHYAVIGDAINIASRLSHASESSVLCDEATVRSCGARMMFESLAPILVKGRSEPMPVWSPLSLVAINAGAAIVGREDALAPLVGALNAAASGQGRACILVGEPGMGKSVLMSAAARTAETRGLRVLTGESSRIEQTTPFQALRSAFAELFGLANLTDTQSRQSRLVEAYGNEFAERLCLINAVIPLAVPESDWATALTPGERVTATRHLLADLLRSVAATRALVLIFEDAHWADDQSLLLIEELIRHPGAIAILIGSRPPGSNLGALAEAGAERVELGPLDRARSADLIASQMRAGQVSDEILDLVFQRALGNPFFTAELTRYLHERGEIGVSADGEVIRAAGSALSLAALPTSVRATITNRIDAMAPAPQLTLKVESVAGLRAPLVMVQHVHPLHVGATIVAEHVLAQTRLGLIERAMVDAVDGYEFRHDITREVVYDLVLPEPKRQLHAEIARWYETHHQQDLAAYFGRVAAHWAAAGEDQRASRYLEQEAIRVFSNGHAQEATSIGLSALRLLGIELPTDPGVIGIRIGEGLGFIQARTADGAAAALAQLPAITDERVARQIALLLSTAPLAFQSNRIDLYALSAITALRLTLEHGASADAPQACSMYSVVHGAMTGDRHAAWQWSQLALEPAERLAGRPFAEVAFVHGWFHAHWQQPLRESVGLSLAAAEQGFASQATMFACFNLAAYVIYQHASGAVLADVIAAARRHLLRSGRLIKNSAFHLIHEMQSAKALAGLTVSPLSFSDAEFDEERDLASILQSNLSNQIGYYLVSKVRVHCLFGDWQVALDWADRARAARPAFAGQTAEFELIQYEGLAAAGLALGGDVSQVDRSRDCAREMRGWAQLCSDNFEHKALLLEGALATVEFRRDEAAARLANAALAARHAGFLQDHGLALEWSARVAAQSGDDRDANLFTLKAAEAYTAWGATAKAEWLLATTAA